ncbi:MAG: thermosome subunit alpha [Candidatus Woesearchaeota archaeon]|jgi:thermosome
MENKDNYQPVYILSEGTQRNTGKSAQRMNILAAKLVSEAVRTTLGPKGMDKMLVDSMGEIIVTNDGATILKEMNIDHPSARMLVEVAKTQEEEVGDGTTTAVVLAGELLRRAEELLDNNIHPTIIAKGYRLAADKSQEILKTLAVKFDKNDKETLLKIVETAITGKGPEDKKDHLAKLIVESIYKVANEHDGKLILSKDDVKVEKKVGGSIEESELIQGIVIDKEKVHAGMPTSIKNAKIALLDMPIEIKGTETEAKISITDPSMLQSFLDVEENMLKKKVERIVSTGATVVFCQKGIDDLAQHFLAKKGIYATRRVKKSDLARLSKATGAKIISDLNEFSKDDLGLAGIVEQVKVGEEFMTYVRDCKNPKSVTLLIRGATSHVIDEVARAVDDAIGDVLSTLSNEYVVAGAGSVEMEVSKELKKFANTLSGREQLAVQAFADTLEIIPRTLAENAGLDPINVLTELKAAHDKNQKWAGINVFTGKIMDSWNEGIIEPLKIKTQAISSASEVAVMILRIDDVILSGKGTPNPLEKNHLD